MIDAGEAGAATTGSRNYFFIAFACRDIHQSTPKPIKNTPSPPKKPKDPPQN